MNTQNKFKILQYFPLTIFLVSTRATGNYRLSFILGGLFALLETGLLIRLKKTLDRFLLGVNLYLALGGIGFVFSIGAIEQIYADLKQSMVFVALGVCGIYTMFQTPNGYINISPNQANPKRILKASMSLMVLTFVAAFWSYHHLGSLIASAYAPFFALVLFRSYLFRKIRLA